MSTAGKLRGSESAAAFSGAAGNYGGLLIVPDADLPPGIQHVPRGHLPNETPLNSGTLTAQVRDSGRFTAVLNWQGYIYRFMGKFNPDTATFERSFKDRDKPGETLELLLTLDAGARILNCALTGLGVPDDANDPDPHYTAEGALSGAEPDDSGAAFAGSLNVSFIAPLDYGSFPVDFRGDGYSITRVSKRKGFSARIIGRLPDNEPFSAGSRLRGTNYTIFSGLYKKNGRFGGLTIGQLSTADRKSIQNILLWTKREGADPDYYPDGFETGFGILTTVFLSPTPGLSSVSKPIPPISTTRGPVRGTLVLKGGNLGKNGSGEDNVIAAKIRISHSGVKILDPNPQRIVMKTNRAATTWKGSFIHPVSGKRTTFQGGFTPAKGGQNGEGRGGFKGSISKRDGGFVESGSARVTVE